MKVIKLDGEVINIGEWDYQMTPVRNPIEYTKEEKKAITLQGRNPFNIYDSDGNIVTEALNPLPKGAIEVEADVIDMEGGGRCVSGDYTKLRKYPPIQEQLDYIYHHGLQKWKTDIIKPVKDKYPKK